MEQGIFSTLVLSGLCNFASSLHLRHYHFVNEPRNWSEARQYCGEEHTDLAVINDEQDLEELAGLIESGNPFVFLGLHRGWGWSLSAADDYKEGEPAYWNWAGGQPTKHYCGSIGPTGEWFATDCSSMLNFFCYDASATDISQRFTLKSDSMTWTSAQAYCRNQHTDLARVRNQLENEELQHIVTSTSVWIGLMRMSWMWSDGSYPSFIPWKGFEPPVPGLGDCAALNVTSNCLGMIQLKCNETAPFICYSEPERKHLVRLKLFADDSSVYMNDPAAMKSVLKWVKKELTKNGASGDVNLTWRKLPEKEKT